MTKTVEEIHKPYVTLRSAFRLWSEMNLEKLSELPGLFINEKEYWDNAIRLSKNATYKSNKDFLYTGYELHEFNEFLKIIFAEPRLQRIFELDYINEMPENMLAYQKKGLMTKFRQIYSEVIKYVEQDLGCNLI